MNFGRKRNHDGDTGFEPDRKRPAVDTFLELPVVDPTQDTDTNITALDTTHATSLRLLVPANLIGAIIGKSGANVKEIQRAGNVTISIAPADEPAFGGVEQVVDVSGDGRSVSMAQQMISNILNGVDPVEDGSINSVIKYIVPDALTKGIIGKGGETVKRISKQSGQPCKIFLAPEASMLKDGSVVRRLLIRGTAETVRKAQLFIAEVVRDLTAAGVPLTSSRSRRSARSHMNQPSSRAFGGGGGGLERPSYGGGRPGGRPGGYGGGGGGGGGYGGGGGGGGRGGYGGGHGRGGGGGAYGYDMHAGMMGAQYGAYGGMPMGAGVAEMQEISFTIPAPMMGLMLGRGGATAKEIEMQAGVHVVIGRDSDIVPGTQKRPVTISGTLQGIELAKNLFERVIVPICGEGLTLVTPSGGGAPGGSYAASLAAVETFSLMVPNDLVPLVIGKRGASVREFNLKSGAEILVAPKEEISNGERPVMIKGTQECIAIAKQLVVAHLEHKSGNKIREQ